MRSIAAIEDVKLELRNFGFVNLPYDRVMFTFHPSYASQNLLAVGNWDETRRNDVRTVLHQARVNFHKHPRPWWVHELYWYMIGMKNITHSHETCYIPEIVLRFFCCSRSPL